MRKLPHCLRRSGPWVLALAALLRLTGAAGAQEPGPAQQTPAEPPLAPAQTAVAAESVPATDASVTGDSAHDAGGGLDWSKIPDIRPTPRVGAFYVPPTGPGYYSLLDVVLGRYREAPPKFPYPPLCFMADSFFNADFRYLDDPNNTQHDFLDCLHRIHIGDNWMFSTGGEVRIREMHETNSRLSGTDQNYQLLRTRIYGDLWYKDRFRVYIEFLDAQIFNNKLAPLPIDANHSDLLNAFVDIKIIDINDHPVYVRAGRQELLLGSERLISPLDWANTRRTFEGVRGFYTGDKWNFDLFWARPEIVFPGRFDTSDQNQNFAGAWATYNFAKGTALDLYYLYLDNQNPKTQLGIVEAPFDVHTLGSRFAGDKNHWLWDVEGMLQLGRRGTEDIVAGAVSVGGGRNFAEVPMNPTLWVCYDYATGDRDPNKGFFNTFNQLFPFGHYYFGFLDLVGRENIHDFSLYLYMNPTKWITFNAQGHVFRLDQAQDALYNAAGNAIRRSATGTASKNVGDEIDLWINFHLGAHSDILAGYSKLFAGEFIKDTGNGRSPDLFYLMYTFRW
jgi:hypothetical protein